MIARKLIFVKGHHQIEIVPVRELTSTAKLEAPLATEPETNRIGFGVGQLEIKRAELEKARLPRPRSNQVPSGKSSRIFVAGAGPSDIAAPPELEKPRYTQVEVYEQAAEVGGKSHTIQIKERHHDLGATMGVSGKYNDVVRLAKQGDQSTIAFPEEFFYDLATAGPVKSGFAEPVKTTIQGLLYFIHIVKTGGLNGRKLELPPSELADPRRVVMSRHDISQFGNEMLPILIGYGYGGPDTPALFGERIIDSSTMYERKTAESRGY